MPAGLLQPTACRCGMDSRMCRTRVPPVGLGFFAALHDASTPKHITAENVSVHNKMDILCLAQPRPFGAVNGLSCVKSGALCHSLLPGRRAAAAREGDGCRSTGVTRAAKSSCSSVVNPLLAPGAKTFGLRFRLLKWV